MKDKSYFFCGIGGSGMLPLALLLREAGAVVAGSDRARDQSRTLDKFAFLEAQGIALFPQDGSGLSGPDQVLVASAAVEETVPDVAAARAVGAERLTRAELLSQLFNRAELSIGIAGTSGKSTTTGMVAWILHAAGRAPTVMNGAVMKNFTGPDRPYASALGGDGSLFVSEIDESDGSIALFSPRVAVVNNISHDHKSLEELYRLFTDFSSKAKTPVLNADDAQSTVLRDAFPKAVTFSLTAAGGDYFALDIAPAPDHIAFVAVDRESGAHVPVRLATPGQHNVANGLAAIATCVAAGVPFEDAARGLSGFEGIARRFDVVGTRNNITVIDDFGHNPDKIAATLKTLRAFPGRLLVMFQPHGFGPLRTLRAGFAACFTDNLTAEDRLFMPEPVYFGGTVDRSVTSADLAADIRAAGGHAEAFATRDECGAQLLAEARPGDRIIIMGARDDTLNDFAKGVLAGV